METTNHITIFIGRLHIVLLHLPIGFLVMLGVLELLSLFPKWRHATLSNRFILGLAAPISVLTAICGWFLAEEGGYDQRLLLLHRWTGVGVAIASCLLLWVCSRGWLNLYRALIFMTMALTIVASHLGGSLTHGSNHLTQHAPAWLGGRSGGQAQTGGNDGGFAEVEPVLSEYCVSCHGSEKAKGGLQLDALDTLLAGGDSGLVLVAGDPESSLLLGRILLPLDDDDHMPPAGKPQPTAEDVARIRDWIRAGMFR